ncbi:MAG: Bro-N domain-containing protein [Oscillospiraceae bacterium]|nr:Bro-N domain-containing protein [Oscillospiraceae bacterium]
MSTSFCPGSATSKNGHFSLFALCSLKFGRTVFQGAKRHFFTLRSRFNGPTPWSDRPIIGEPWFVGKDVALALGYERPAKAIPDHVDEEDRKMVDGKTQSQFGIELGQRGGWLINESGLYSLVLSSKLPGAKKFRRWVILSRPVSCAHSFASIRAAAIPMAKPFSSRKPSSTMASYSRSGYASDGADPSSLSRKLSSSRCTSAASSGAGSFTFS